jgi:hypothetical protein
MTTTQIEKNIAQLISALNKNTFIYDLLLAYALPKASITRLRKGNLNLGTEEGEIVWKKKLYFKAELEEDLHATIFAKNKSITHHERFVVVTDYTTLLAIDTKTQDRLDIPLLDLPQHYDFFLPWAGMEKAQHQDENPADVKAAEKMAKLFDVIKKDNPDDSPEFMHGLNVFLSRLLFCFFAEDTHIFDENQFTNAIDSHTQADGSDLHTFLDTFFEVLNTPKGQSDKLRSLSGVEVPVYLNAFPYVNGGLFRDPLPSPKCSRSSRAAILNSGDQNWSAINPDIFGSMFQAVIGEDQRGNLGQHYTSVPNIMKVIEPLFLNDLYEELDNVVKTQNIASQKKKLEALLHRIHNLKIFDPACGSGNFLIIAYKELRILEMKIFKAGGMMALSGIHLSQFYGIEIDDFAGEIAKLALWLAEHQMNVAFRKEFGRTNPTLPLSEAGHIVQGNACRLDWEVVCPKQDGDEIYILGNPPYLGGKLLDASQKKDTAIVFSILTKFNNIDYIGCWFFKAAGYINDYIKSAFVSTNSICQGTQSYDLWPTIFNKNIEIGFAVKDFVWNNNAKNKAAVICSIISLRKISNDVKTIYYGGHKRTVKNINSYLIDAPNVFIDRRTSILSQLPRMIQGNIALDEGLLQLSKEEKEDLIYKYPESAKIIRRIYGSKELINDIDRFCLWIEDQNLEFANSIDVVKERIEKVKEIRLKGATNAMSCANRSHQFCMTNTSDITQIILPIVSSARRSFIPMKFMDSTVIVTHAAQVVPDCEPFIFGILNSSIHMVWVKSLAGKLKNDYRYSAGICWNSFPFPNISTQRKGKGGQK